MIVPESGSRNVSCSLAFLFKAGTSNAQDAALVNSKIVKIEFENDKVRVLRALYRPHDRLEMLPSGYGGGTNHGWCVAHTDV
jgi:hypothetical protein